MDAIDGKQARRTGMSSALGEMFDHGCDAINTTLEVILCAHALGLGRSWWTVASQAASLCNFYASTWEEYHTGTLYLSAFSGPVEGILMICAIYLITAVHPLGPGFWAQPVVSFVPGNKGVELAQYLDGVLGLKGDMRLEGVGINVAFMTVGAMGTLGNIVNSCVLPLHFRSLVDVFRLAEQMLTPATTTSSRPVAKPANPSSHPYSATSHSSPTQSSSSSGSRRNSVAASKSCTMRDSSPSSVTGE